MSKKMKILVSVLVAILVLTVGGTTIALAQDDEDVEPEEELATEVTPNGFLARVAEILDIPEEELIEVFQQVRQEMMAERCDDAFNQALDKAVAEELLTPEEAEEIREWWEEKPEVLAPGLLQRAFGFRNQQCGQLPGVRQGQRSEIKQRLALKFQERAGERAGIAQDESAEMNQWRQNRPEVSNALPSPARISKSFRSRQQVAVPRGWQGQITDEIAD